MDAIERIREEKRSLRSELRAARRALDPAAGMARAAAVLGFATSDAALRRAEALAGYVAVDGELDVGPLLSHFARAGVQILLPRVSASGPLELVASDPGAIPAALPGQIHRPAGPPAKLAQLPPSGVILAPCVAADRSGTRLGRGGGHYDRLLPLLQERGWHCVAVSHTEQVCDQLPHEPHDVRLERILTESGWIEPRPARGPERSAGVVLAGGRSARMGRPKELLEVAGIPMLRRIVDTLRACCDQVYLVGDPSAERLATYFAAELTQGWLHLLRDPEPYAGPAVALTHALARIDTDLVFASGCDTPLLAPELVRGLLTLATSPPGWDAVAPAPGGLLEPLLAVYRRAAILPALQEATRHGPISLQRLLGGLRVRRVGNAGLARLDPTGRSLLNVNSERDLAEVARHAAFDQ